MNITKGKSIKIIEDFITILLVCSYYIGLITGKLFSYNSEFRNFLFG